jgi:hypothetical protein
MDPEIKFFFYLAAVVCFLLAAVAAQGGMLSRTRRSMPASGSLLPLGLALFAIPFLWDVGTRAF